MGKISKALDKYARERKLDSKEAVSTLPPLTYEDIQSLVGYDKKTGHLLRCNPETGEVDEKLIEELRARGTILRLLENYLIYPGGKLTARGFEEARRLAAAGAAIPSRPRVTGAEMDQVLQVNELLSGKALPSTPKTEPKAEPFVAVTSSPAETDKKILESSGSTYVSHSLGTPPGGVPRPLKVVGETKPVASKTIASEMPKLDEILSERRPSSVWDEALIDPKLVAVMDPRSSEAEQFKILRTNILFPLEGIAPRSILITSPGPGEGKTFTAANLAISIALNINRHVLLIDADMRQPQVHKRFGFGMVPGLSDYLTKGHPLPSLLLKTKVEKLTLLPAGEPPENPAELIGAERMSSLIAEVANRYPDRIVVIDAPPPSMAAETAVLARHVDGILVVVRYGKTRRDHLADLVVNLGEKKILGSVVNFIEPVATRYYKCVYGYGSRRSEKK